MNAPLLRGGGGGEGGEAGSVHARARAWRVQLRAQDRRRGVLVQVLPITGFLINKFLKQNVFLFYLYHLL